MSTDAGTELDDVSGLRSGRGDAHDESLLGDEISGAAAMAEPGRNRLADPLGGELEPVEKWAVRGLGGIVVTVSIILCIVALVTLVTLNALHHPKGFAYYHDAFLVGVDKDRLSRNLYDFTRVPHMAGSENDRLLAERIRKDWTGWGIESELVPYYPLLSKPGYIDVRTVGLPGGDHVVDFTEPEIPGDETSKPGLGAAPAFNAYSAPHQPRTVAPIVYVNYGRVEDFQYLEDNGVELAGKIALARYGENFRGVKAMIAESRNMTGILIYSDPQDDGYGKGAVYPDGPWRPEHAVQRGSTQFLSIRAGDPMTPGVAARKGVREVVSRNDVDNCPKTIMVQPLAYADAQVLLQNLSGAVAPDAWQGALPLTYHTGPSTFQVSMLIQPRETREEAIWNVIGKVRGSKYPDEVVIIGNHHDAWTFGAIDPNTGSAVLHEIVRGIGRQIEHGWQPERTIIFASWSGEEFALLGSTEWCEDNAQMLQSKAVAYINTDVGVAGGNLSVSSTPNMDQFIYRVAQGVHAPGTDDFVSLYDAWLQNTRDSVPHAQEPEIRRLGSGSDFTGFLQYLGISAMDASFYGAYGVYHSNYDSYHMVATHIDPTWEIHESMTKFLGSVVMQLAHEPVIPFDFVDYAIDLQRGIDQVIRKLPPGPDQHMVSLRELEAAIHALMATAVSVRQQQVKYAANVDAFADVEIPLLNRRLMLTEREFLASDVVLGRTWNFFRHLIYVPGRFEGYEGVMYPEISEGIDNRDWVAAQRGVERVAYRIERAARVLGGLEDPRSDHH